MQKAADTLEGSASCQGGVSGFSLKGSGFRVCGLHKLVGAMEEGLLFNMNPEVQARAARIAKVSDLLQNRIDLSLLVITKLLDQSLSGSAV